MSSVLWISVPEKVLIERASGRRLCRTCGQSYHLAFNPPAQEGVCDRDGGDLQQREDDKPDTVRQRLAVYMEQTSPLVDYYRGRGILSEINGDQPIEAVEKVIAAVIGN